MIGEPKRLDAPHYVIDPDAPLPRRWLDHYGPIRVMCEPVEGYVLAKRPRCRPFVLHVSELLNAEPHRTHGPFQVVERKPNCRTTTGE